jgi:hypothetical protein
MPRRTGVSLLLPAVLAALVACAPRPAPPPGQTAPQEPATPMPAPAPAPAPAPVFPADPAPAPAQPPAPPEPERLADPERNAVLFTHWRSSRAVEVEAFENFLVYEKLARVAPTYQLLRSASMWKECRAEPFQLPPPRLWPEVRDVLRLLQELRARGVLPEFEVVSAYRPPRLNRCAGGAPGSSHQRFAVDLAPLDDATAARLCRFWRQEGARWDMGMSRYPSGRIHIDRNGYRTWGASHGRGSSHCLR